MLASGAAMPAAAALPAAAKKEKKEKKEKAPKKEKKVEPKKEEEDDDFDVFGDDDEEESEEPKETRAEMLERLKKEANERLSKKLANQRTLVGIEIKPFDTEQDLKALWTRIVSGEVEGTCPPGIKWGEMCHLVEVAFGIKKIVTNFSMGTNDSADDIIEAITNLEDEVQSVEMTGMNVL
jgi:translation elongation factor EF-1beta